MHQVPALGAVIGLSGVVAAADGGSLSTLIAQIVVAVLVYFLGRTGKK